MSKTAVSSAIIQRFSAATATPYAFTERCTRPLIELDRFISRSRRQLRASDLRSLFNAIAGGNATDAAEIDTLFSDLTYKSSWHAQSADRHDQFEQRPAFGDGNWGQVLDRLIENAPPFLNYYPEPAKDRGQGVSLPNTIELCLNPLSITLIWLGPNSAPRRQDFYGPAPSAATRHSSPFGPANLLFRKTFVDGRLLSVAGDILRDANANRSTDIQPKPKTKRQPPARKVGARRA